MEDGKRQPPEEATSKEAAAPDTPSTSTDQGTGGHDRDTYARALRAIGGDLESLNVQAFHLESRVAHFVVRIEKRLSGACTKSPLRSSFKGIWRRILNSSQQEAPEPSEIRYGADEIERLDRRGQTRREESRGLADTYRLSQVLRIAGAYVDLKEARLVSVSLRDERITIEYRTKSGTKRIEEHRIASLYDFAVNMYLQRADRKS